MREIAEAAWRCADPGVQYDTTINQWHTSPNSGRINASNPCSEYMHVDDSACNLASLNLMKFRRADGTFDVERFEHAVDVVLLAQEIVVGAVELPDRGDRRATRARSASSASATPTSARYLMANGMPYDSDEGRGDGGGDHRADDRPRVRCSRRKVAAAIGPVRALRGEPRGAQQRHAHAPRRVLRDPGLRRATTSELLAAARASRGTRRSRSASSTATATRRRRCSRPTGTISFLMDCDTTGIEPDFSLVKFKELVGGGTMTIVNRTVPLALRTLGYADAADRADRGAHRRARHDRRRARPRPTSTCRCSTSRSASARSRTWATSR